MAHVTQYSAGEAKALIAGLVAQDLDPERINRYFIIVETVDGNGFSGTNIKSAHEQAWLVSRVLTVLIEEAANNSDGT